MYSVPRCPSACMYVLFFSTLSEEDLLTHQRKRDGDDIGYLLPFRSQYCIQYLLIVKATSAGAGLSQARQSSWFNMKGRLSQRCTRSGRASWPLSVRVAFVAVCTGSGHRVYNVYWGVGLRFMLVGVRFFHSFQSLEYSEACINMRRRSVTIREILQ